MWWWFRREREAERAAFLAAIAAMQQVAEGQTRAAEAQAAVLAKHLEVLSGYLALFKVPEAPQARMWDDEQAWRREQDAALAEASGTTDPREQLAFVLQSME